MKFKWIIIGVDDGIVKKVWMYTRSVLSKEKITNKNWKTEKNLTEFDNNPK
jgi:hypothetical protein